MPLIGTSTIVFPKLDNKENSSAKRKHICNVCSRAFKRSEHCIRHQRGHTQEKPFGCRVCRRRYSRRDLLVRHERTLHSAEQLARAIGQQTPPDQKKLALSSACATVKSTTSILTNGPAKPHQTGPVNNTVNDGAAAQRTNSTSPRELRSTTQSQSSHGRQRKAGHRTDEKPGLDPAVPAKRPTRPASDTGSTNQLVTPPEGHPNPSVAHAPTTASAIGLPIADFSVDMADLEKMRTFPSSVPLPDLDGDLEFLDFFDPFLGMSPKQVANFGLPPLTGAVDGWSPLENFSVSSQTSTQDYGFQHSSYNPTSNDSQMADDISPLLDSGADSSADFVAALHNSCESPMIHNLPTPAAEPGADYASPKLHQPTPTRFPGLVFTERMRGNLLEDLSTRLPHGELCNFRLPSAAALQKCIRTYVEAFHVHLPIFHFHTMDFETTPSPLVLAICAIGALYRLERKVAASLYVKADQALLAAVDRGRRLEKKPRLLEDWVKPTEESPASYREALWTSQTRLLLAMLSCFSGDTELISKAIVRLGDFLIDYRQLAPSVKSRKIGKDDLSWAKWIERESVKRLLYGHIMYGNLVTMTYAIPPGYSVVSDGYIEMPCDQSLWDAATEEQWRIAAATKGKSSPLSVKDAVSKVMYGHAAPIVQSLPEDCWEWSPFAISVVINVIAIHIWHISQGSYFFGDFAGTTTQHGSKSQTLTQTEAALSRCRALITQARSDADYPWTEQAETPLLFNCLALLRVSYCRAFTGAGAADSMIMLKEGHEDLLVSIEDYVAMPQSRSDLITRAVSRAFEGMLIPYKSGTLLIKKTAALTWAVGHALAGWETALLVTKWLHAIEMETRSSTGGLIGDLEAQTVQTIRNLLSELDDGEEHSSLAAKLARHWAGFYDDTWVWGITPRMGWILRELANCYERTLAVS